MINSIALFLIIAVIALLPSKSQSVDNISGGGISLTYSNVLRGVAILIIMIGHISGTMGTVAFSPLGGTGVALFLFISGYGLSESWKKSGTKSYWAKKIKRVFIPYFVVISILAMYKSNVSLQSYLLDIFGIKTSYWYIGYLVKWYVLFWLASRFAFKCRMAILGCCALAFLFILPNIEAEQSLSFVFGVWVSDNVDKVVRLSRKQICYIGLLTFVIGTAFLAIKQLPEIRAHIDDYVYNIVQLFIKLPYAITIMCCVWLFPAIQRSRFVMLAGAVSYELYLVHMPFYGSVNGSLVYGLVLIACSFVAAKLFNLFNSRIGKIRLNFV